MTRKNPDEGTETRRRIALTRPSFGAGQLLASSHEVPGDHSAARRRRIPLHARRFIGEKRRASRRALRLGGVIAAVAALMTFGAGVAFGLLSNAVKSGTHKFSAGTVTLTKTSSQTCTVSNMAPGDSSTTYTPRGKGDDDGQGGQGNQGNQGGQGNQGDNDSQGSQGAQNAQGNQGNQDGNGTDGDGDADDNQGGNGTDGDGDGDDHGGGGVHDDPQCSITVSYTGSVPAYLGLDIGITGTPGTTKPPAGLFDGTTTGLQLLVQETQGHDYGSQGQNPSNNGKPLVFVDGTTYTTKTGSQGAMTATSVATDLLADPTPVTTGTTVTFTLDYALPATAPSGYQGASSTFTLTVHAVQAKHNTPAGCHAGKQCPAVPGGFQWH